ncbi:MAG: phenylacetic acid degradation bifunctional protein PaaZ [SAR324 cluster bacterium]|nr:phenylacetic acid degradation bifunctional protein PaaZ [SAR324 cluster bacterium]
MIQKFKSYALEKWVEGEGQGQVILHAVTGEPLGEVSSRGLDFKAMLNYARTIGGPAIRCMTFHERALLLKNMAKYLMERKEEFYTLSTATGATRADSWVDIEGGIATFFAYSGIGRREFPNETFHLETDVSPLSKSGSFIGRHICTPLDGTAVHINAFNFPCWGMLEKLATTFLAGMPAIVKSASQTCYLTEKMVAAMIESGLLPEGVLQLICGSVGDLFEHLGSQDVVTFTGSATTGRKLKSHPNIIEKAIRFNMEADSLNCIILGPDVTPEMEEFTIFIKEVVREMTAKAGQKCTAIRRTIVPEGMTKSVIDALKQRLTTVQVGHPEAEGVRMGTLAGLDQVKEVQERVAELLQGAELVFGEHEEFEVVDADRTKGAFYEPTLLYCAEPLRIDSVHEIEAFGPVNTVMPYADLDEAIRLAAKGGGSLVASVVTADDVIARKLVLGIAPHHGRVLVLNRESAPESTGHGSPMPSLVHGGPGRAGGGEEMGGARGVLHYMQRTALQGSPTTLKNITGEWTKGAAQSLEKVHPFRKYFNELEIGDTLLTHRRTVTEADVVNFAALSGDWFYAHVDEVGVQESPVFERRVAHGYFILSAAAGLFVDPAPGPVLANYGLENLRFTQPVYIGDTIQAKLTCKTKTPKAPREGKVPQGVVSWAVEVINQKSETVVVYTILTLVAQKQPVVGLHKNKGMLK